MVTSDLPDDVRDALLARWREPHRHYHGVTHLEYGLRALEELGGGMIERIAFWCHDAVHSNTTPDDELASAEVARELLADHLTIPELHEVVRLVMVTIHHSPEEGDDAGARVSDADLAALAADPETYERNIAGIRAEMPSITDEQWRTGRAAFLDGFLAYERLFHTAEGIERWERRARENLERERRGLRRGA